MRLPGWHVCGCETGSQRGELLLEGNIKIITKKERFYRPFLEQR